MRTLLTLSLLLVGPAAWSQGTSNTTVSTSTSRTQTLHVTNATAEVDNYLTRITARFGSGPLLYDQSFNVQVSDPTVQAAIQQARNQLTGAAAVSGPTQVSNVKALTGTSQSTVINSTQVATDVVLETDVGPAIILIADRGLCTGLTGTAPQRLPTGCPGGTPFSVAPGTRNLNLNTNTQADIFQTVTTTSTFQIAQTYELNGTAPVSPPTTPAPPSLWLALGGIAASGIYYMKRNRNPNGA